MARMHSQTVSSRAWRGRSLLVVASVAATALLAAVAVDRRTDAGTTGPAPTRVGPTAEQAGVPVGYAPTQAGAVAAAVNYSTALSGALSRDDAHRVAAIEAVSAAGSDSAVQLGRAAAFGPGTGGMLGVRFDRDA